MNSLENPVAPEIRPSPPAVSFTGDAQDRAGTREPPRLDPNQDPDQNPAPPEFQGLHWALIGNQGLRAGWSILIFVILYRLFTRILGTVVVGLYPGLANLDFSPALAIVGESVPLLAALAAVAFVAHIENRKILDYNLTGPRRPLHLITGLAAGFAVLSALVGALDWGGWLHFGPIALSGAAIFKYGALWACAFLLIGCLEEGIFRCYLQFTLTRGIDFRWALGIIAFLCLDLLLRSKGNAGILTFIWLDPLPTVKGNGAWGVYAIALLGLIPCLLLHVNKAGGSSFWQASWVTSTLFGFIHTGNNGENWIGIFAAAAIGFVFCVSVRVTGSAWWAIGCHTAWDWAETYFYGTADSGLQAQGHYLTASPAGAVLWSGGTDGPEGSLLVLGVIFLLLFALLVMYGRRKAKTVPAPGLEQTANGESAA